MNTTLTFCGFVGFSIHAAMLLHGAGCLDGDRVSISVYSGSSCYSFWDFSVYRFD